MSKLNIQQIQSKDMYNRYISNSQLKEILKTKKLSDTITLEEAIILIAEACFIFGSAYIETPHQCPTHKKGANEFINSVQKILNN